MSKLKGWIKTVDRYFFGLGSPVALGVLRIFVGILALINTLMLGRDWDTWFSERGFVPASTNQQFAGGDPYVWYHGRDIPFWLGGNVAPRIGLFGMSVNPIFSQILFWSIAVFALLTALGLWTRVSTFMLAIGLVSLHQRNLIILHGGDTALRLMALYLALGPSGAACSVDRLIAIWQGRAEFPALRSVWAQRLITYNLALLYLTTVWIRMYGHRWKDGTATWYTSRLAEFYRFPYPNFLRNFPFVSVTTHMTMLIEFGLATMVFFRPVRKYALIGGLLLHGGIEYSMNIPLFGYVMTSMYVCFYDGEEVTGWFRRLGERLRRFKVTVHLPSGKQLRPNIAAFLRALDPLGLVSFVAGDKETLYATRSNGAVVNGRWAIMTHSLGAWPFLALPWLWSLLLSHCFES